MKVFNNLPEEIKNVIGNLKSLKLLLKCVIPVVLSQ